MRVAMVAEFEAFSCLIVGVIHQWWAVLSALAISPLYWLRYVTVGAYISDQREVALVRAFSALPSLWRERPLWLIE